MEDIVIKSEDLQKMLLTSIPVILKEKYESTYSNPLKDVIDEEIKNSDGAIRIFIRDVIENSLTDSDFRNKLSGEVIGRMIELALKR